jgi:hypothetical protein
MNSSRCGGVINKEMAGSAHISLFWESPISEGERFEYYACDPWAITFASELQ